MEQYQYEPLSSSRKEIRLMLLYPRESSRSEELRVTIFNTPLEAEYRIWPDFGALSYVWGDPTKRRDLLVVGASEGTPPRRLSVTENLAIALSYLPFPDKHMVLWVDAICINQDDLEERAEQVKLMPDIYSSASLVHAWLGPPTHDSNLAMNLLHRISDSIDVDWSSFEIRPKESIWTRQNPFYFQLLLDPHFALPWDGPESQALESLLNRPWFERLWIRQEITLGGKRAALLCGHSSIDWMAFRKAAVLLHHKLRDHKHPREDQWIARTELVLDTCIQNATWLGQMLRQMQRTECADPRDRVYGIMGILPAESSVLADRIQPDYRKPVVEVYKELVLAEMEVTARADLLSECRISKGATSTWKYSWVPNWSVKREWNITMMQQCADGQSAVEAFCSGQGCLQVKGVLAATIVDVLEIPPLIVSQNMRNVSAIEQTLQLPPVVEFIKGIAEKLDLSAAAPYHPVAGGNVVEALCYAFSGAGHVREHISDEMTRPDTPNLAQFKRLIQFALNFSDKDMKPSAPRSDADVRADVLLCTAAMYRSCRDRTLLITKEGYVGVGPAGAQPGDQIAVVLGCMRPLVLRPRNRNGDGTTDPKGETSQEGNSAYSIVGPCNAHGLNWGEALLGPLPQGMTFIWSFSGPFGSADPAFRDSNTGEETVADPRVDWDLLKTNGREERSFVQRKSTVAEVILNGADEVTYYRRPDTEYFEKKGVILRTFSLV